MRKTLDPIGQAGGIGIAAAAAAVVVPELVAAGEQAAVMATLRLLLRLRVGIGAGAASGGAVTLGQRGCSAGGGGCAARVLPMLAKGPGGKMLGEAVGHLKTLPGAERAGAFREFATQITEATGGQWSATESVARNGVIFSGEGGEMLAFDAAGNIFKGHFTLGETVMPGSGTDLIIVFDKLKGLQ